MNVLVVDDDRTIRNMLTRFLSDRGYTVKCCEEGEEALEEFQKDEYPLVISDIMMPRMNGYELCQHMRKLPQGDRTVILMMTAYNSPEVLQKVLDAGADDYLAKPLELKSLGIRLKIAEQRYQNRLDRMQAITAVQKSEKKLQDITSALGEGVFTLDNTGRLTFMNPEAERLLGWKEDELSGEQIADIICVNYDQKDDCPILNVINTGEVYRTDEDIFLCKDASTIPVAYVSTPIVENDHIVGSVTAFQNITQRKKAQDTLRLLNSAIETVELGVTITDINGEIRYTNPAEAYLHGYTEADLIGQESRIFAPQEQRKKATLEQVKKMRHWRRESINIRKDGSTFPVQLISTAVKNDRDNIIGIITICEDITERKQMEETLRKSEETARALLNATVDSTLLIDRNGIILAANTTIAQRLNKKDPDELVGQCIYGLFSEKVSAGRKKQIEKAIHQKKAVRFEDERAGMIMDNHVYPVFDWEGNVDRLAIFARDISESKKMESELLQAKTAAETANKAKSEFLANMSHELRTPLNAVLGYAQILRKQSGFTEQQKEGLEIIESSGEHLLTLINDILDLSKIEAGRMMLDPVEFDFPEFLKNIAEIIKVRAEQKGIDFVYKKVSELPVGIKADEKKLRQVLLNLLGNAVKYTKKGHVVFKVGFNKKTRKFRFQVEDTGIGISKEDLKDIFLPFHQVSQTRHFTEGTGLGLAITQKLVKMMDSQLQVKSELNRGSIFWFEVDLVEIPTFVPAFDNEEKIIVGYQGQKRRILVVDDKWENRSVLVDMLSPLGFDIIEAKDGQECLNKSTKYKPDAILLDLRMPIIDGFEAARRLRESPASRDAVIIAVSASAFAHDRRDSIASGCDDFIPKPVKTESLLKTLSRHLHLEWLYEKDSTKDMETEITTSAQKLTSSEIETLYQLATYGNIKKILATLDNIENKNGQSSPLLVKLRKMTRSFQLNAMINLLENFKEDK